MPRPTLPAALKKLWTFQVILTQTTEEELWQHFTDKFREYENQRDYLINKIEALGDEMNLNNPFSHQSFSKSRRTQPSRKYNNLNGVAVEVFLEHNDEIEWNRYLIISKLNSDLKRCGKELKWDENVKYAAQFLEWTALSEQTVWELETALTTLATTEECCYYVAKRQWEIAHADEILQQKETEIARSKHLGHVDVDPECSLCIFAEKLRTFQEKEALARAIQEQEDAAEMLFMRQEEERVERELEEERKLMAPLTCKMCDYSTTTPSKYDIHLSSRDHTNRHKLRATYCDVCQVQCKNNVDYDIHTATQKHKKKIGEIVEPAEYRCNACDYTTPSKYLYKAHCDTKTHRNKMEALL